MRAALVITIIVAAASRLLAEEIRAWINWLHVRLRRAAVGMLPHERRERYDEEWRGALDETPGDVLKLLFSVGLIPAAASIHLASPKDAVEGGNRFLLLKRLIDIVGSFSALVFYAPCVLLIALAVRVESSGPVFFGSVRVGKGGRLFHVRKFRTMSLGILEGRDFPTMRASGLRATQFRCGAVPRVTRVGRFLRRTGLDELPQLINVFVGDMTLVGQPPLTLNEVSRRGLVVRLSPGVIPPAAIKRRMGHSIQFARLRLKSLGRKICGFLRQS